MADRGPGSVPANFARLLRELRHQAGLTQEELAAVAELSPRALGNLERGRSAPHRGTANRLAEALRLGDEDAELLRRFARLRTAAEHSLTDAPAPPDAEESYRALDAESTAVFAVIGLHPTRLVSADAVIAAAAIPADAARRALDRIAAAGLITWSADGEIETSTADHAFAGERTAARLGLAEQADVRGRLVRWHLATADAADRVIAPLRFRPGVAEAVADHPHRVFSGRTEAIAWCDRHLDCLCTLAELAYRSTDPAPAWQFPWALGGYLDLRRPPEMYLRMHQIGLACAREHDDPRGQAAMLGGLGLAHYYPRRFDDAAECFREARALWRRLGEPVGEAGVINCLANVHLETRRFAAAVTHYREALALYRTAGDRRGEAVVLTNLAETYCERGDFPQAAEQARNAVLTGRDAAYPRIEVMAACQLARALAATGRANEAEGLFDQALAISRGTADRHALAWTLTYLGHHLRSHKAADRAAAAWREAIDIFDELADPHAARLRAELVTLT